MHNSIEGILFDGLTSTINASTLKYEHEGLIQIEAHNMGPMSIQDLNISPRIGNTARYIDFPDGSQFETQDNNAVDDMCRRLGHTDRQSFIHYLESHKRYVIATLAIVGLFISVMLKWGIPAASHNIAAKLPPEVAEMIGSKAFDYMDNQWLEESQLDLQRQQSLRGLFQNHAQNTATKQTLNIHFRQGELMGANAFALPNGSIVFTDDLILLAENDAEIEAIMLHEIGHVLHHHSLRYALQQFSLTMLTMVITGDITTSSSLIVAVPSLLVSQGYSRDMEREADDHAFQTMKEANIPHEHFAHMMEKLEAFYSVDFETCSNKGEQLHDCLEQAISSNKQKDEEAKPLESYLSTHPISKDRIERFRSKE